MSGRVSESDRKTERFNGFTLFLWLWHLTELLFRCLLREPVSSSQRSLVDSSSGRERSCVSGSDFGGMKGEDVISLSTGLNYVQFRRRNSPLFSWYLSVYASFSSSLSSFESTKTLNLNTPLHNWCFQKKSEMCMKCSRHFTRITRVFHLVELLLLWILYHSLLNQMSLQNLQINKGFYRAAKQAQHVFTMSTFNTLKTC